MWDSPYHACRLSTDNTWVPVALTGTSAIFSSGMTGPQISFLDALVLGQIGIIAFRQHLAARQHGDDVREVRHHGQIMFDHQNGVLRLTALDRRHALFKFLRTSPDHRFL